MKELTETVSLKQALERMNNIPQLTEITKSLFPVWRRYMKDFIEFDMLTLVEHPDTKIGQRILINVLTIMLHNHDGIRVEIPHCVCGKPDCLTVFYNEQPITDEKFASSSLALKLSDAFIGMTLSEIQFRLSTKPTQA